MVEVLEQAEAIDLRQVRVRLVLGDAGRDLDRDLLEADRGLERRLVRRVEPVDQRLLVLLERRTWASASCSGSVHARAGVPEAQRLGLDAVHQDDAHPREGVVVSLL